MILPLDQDKPNQPKSASKHNSFDMLYTLPRLPEEGFETLQLPEIRRASLGCRKESLREDFFLSHLGGGGAGHRVALPWVERQHACHV